MSLTTCCTHCRTVFRVTPEQLQAHGGQVRCGRCMQVFNGLAALVPDMPPAAGKPEPVAAAPAPAPASEPSPVVTVADSVESVHAPVFAPLPPEPLPTSTGDPGPPVAFTEPAPAIDTDEGSGAPLEILPEALLPQAPEAEPMVKAEGPPIALGAAENPFIHEAEAEPAPAPRGPWLAVASVLLGVALAAQAIYVYRGEIAARHPLARQWLSAACAEAGCTLPLPQLPKAIVIEASDLQAVDPARPNRIQLTATLRNHAVHDVAYPALDLVLTNANDHTLARRIFLPAEYLGGGRDPRAGIAANAELTVHLALETGGLGAAGFRLAVLPAPQR